MSDAYDFVTAVKELNGITGWVNIHPNPTNDFLNIELPEYKGNATVLFYNSLGIQVFEYKYENAIEKGIKLNLNGLFTGIYWIEIICQNKIYRSMVIKIF